MKILIFDSYYDEALAAAGAAAPDLAARGYAEQLKVIYGLGFARCDFLLGHLRDLGHAAEQIVVNVPSLREAWARENGVSRRGGLGALALRTGCSVRRRWRRWRTGLPIVAEDAFMAAVTRAQVEAFDPDVILDTDVYQFSSDFLRSLKRPGRTLVGEVGYPIASDFPLDHYDRLVSCNPLFVERFRRQNLRAELWTHGFEHTILQRLPPAEPPEGVVFLGSLGRDHSARLALLETVARQVELHCHARVSGELSAASALRGRIRPLVWGYEMYRALRAARITINHHIDISGNAAANVRLFEATGVGTLLVTDSKANLPEIFDVGREVVAYESAADCVEKVRYYLAYEDERRAIAAAGQRRTLQSHTLKQRAAELVRIVGG